MSPQEEKKLRDRLKRLDETVWEGRVKQSNLNTWLENFSGASTSGNAAKEQDHALHLLSQFIYYGEREIKELLVAAYRDHFLYGLVQDIRTANPTASKSAVSDFARQKLSQTRFLPVGNPSESGSHLLYFFRQENALPKDLFCSLEHAFDLDQSPIALRDATIDRLVFFDDLCGSGSQVRDYLGPFLRGIKHRHPSLKIEYLILVATSDGKDFVQSLNIFDKVHCTIVFDQHYRAYSNESIFFSTPLPASIDKSESEMIMRHYGSNLLDFDNALGWNDCQLLVGFHHNTPDNTLPVFWKKSEIPSWTPIFYRYEKQY